jgi:CheY-like chemotaxis protein
MEETIKTLFVDERRLKQMLVNLLSNAVKFTPENGTIGLEVRNDPQNNAIKFIVWDTGIGIKEEDQNRLFQPFTQVNAALTREAGGTGLGLALVAKMVKLHGGRVELESEYGKGSRFTLTLPVEDELLATVPPPKKMTGLLPAIHPAVQKQRTILLVEDTEETVMVIRDYLEYAGYIVQVAKNGRDGVTLAQKIQPDLILMDVQMPGMDGLEATSLLREQTQFERTPIVALTAFAMPSDRERCLAAGMNEYLSKPVHLKTLLKTIQFFIADNRRPA